MPNALLTQENLRRMQEYESDSDEEINVNDESDLEDDRGRRSRSSSPVDVVETSPREGQPLQLTMHDRD